MKALAIATMLVAGAASAAPNPVFDKSGISNWNEAPKQGEEPTFKPPAAKRVRLANGMQVLVVENHKLPIASFVLVVPGAGTADDPKGKAGLAAFTTDMIDEGAGGLSAIGISEETARLGMTVGLGADTDAAYVSASTLTKTLEPSLALLTTLVTQPTFDPKEADRVKGDRVTSLELRRDRPREVVGIMLGAALYGATSPYGHPGGGTRDELKGITVADAKAFYTAHWNPAAMTLVVVGDVDAAGLKAKLDGGLGSWKPAGAKRPARPVATAQKLTNRLLIANRPDAAQSDVRIGIIGPERKDKRYFAFEVYRNALGGSFTSRLNNRLREQLGITYGASASMDWRVARGPFIIGSAIVTKATGQGIDEALKIVGGMTSGDLPADELEKAKQNMIRALPAQFDTNASTAGVFAELALMGLPDNWYAGYTAAIRKVTAADVRAAAKAFAPEKQLVIAIVGDQAKIQADLDKLNLGAPAMFDLYGVKLAK